MSFAGHEGLRYLCGRRLNDEVQTGYLEGLFLISNAHPLRVAPVREWTDEIQIAFGIELGSNAYVVL